MPAASKPPVRAPRSTSDPPESQAIYPAALPIIETMQKSSFGTVKHSIADTIPLNTKGCGPPAKYITSRNTKKASGAQNSRFHQPKSIPRRHTHRIYTSGSTTSRDTMI